MLTPTELSNTRDKARTRRAILDAAERLFSERGSGVSVAEIAAAADVSKGGLLHHFSSRDSLVLAVIEDIVDSFRNEVHANVDLSEDRPGKLLRGYVRALTGNSPTVTVMFSPTSAINTLSITPAIDEVLQRDAQMWRAAFAADGIAPEQSLVIRCAAEGLAASAGTPYLHDDEFAAARQRLLDLTERPDTHVRTADVPYSAK